MKSLIRHLIARIYYVTDHYLKRLQGKVLILTYHRVLSETEINKHCIQPGMYVRKDIFEMQMQFLLNNFQILSFSELLDLYKNKRFEKNKRYCVITFDDGWHDNYIYAYPILRKYNIPATIFLPTAFIGTNRWFWPDRLIYILDRLNGKLEHLEIPGLERGFSTMKRRLEVIDLVVEECKKLHEEEINILIEEMANATHMKFPDERMVVTWKEVEDMSRDNITFGSHSSSHRLLTKIPSNYVKQELVDSMQKLIDKKVNYVPVFSYPNGNYNNEILGLVRDCGYEAAVTTRLGIEYHLSSQNLFELKRIGIHNDISHTIPLFTWRISALE